MLITELFVPDWCSVPEQISWTLVQKQQHEHKHPKKQKKWLLATSRKNPPALLYVSRNAFTTVKCFKVLGINISDDLRWDAHIHALCAKTATRLYFLKILKCSGLAVEDFLCFYKCVICAVVKYSCIVWHHSVTAGQSDWLEALQKWALHIILHPLELPNSSSVTFCDIKNLKSRRHNFQIKFFKQICHPKSCLHDLLPPEWDPSLSARLHHPTVCPVPHVRTKH